MEFLTQIAAIGGTLSLLWLTLNTLKKARARANTTASLTVQQRIPLTNGCQLVVVHWDGRELLLATGSQPCTLLTGRPTTQAQIETETQSVWVL